MALLTQRAILRTFAEMLEEMPFEKITVSALVKRCGVSSNTFYYHYQDIFELLEVWLNKVVEETLKQCVDPKDWKEDIVALFLTCQNHPNVVRHIFSALSRERLENYVFSRTEDAFTRYVREKAQDKNISNQLIAEIAEFCRFSVVGYFLKFMHEHLTADVNEYVNHMVKLIDIFVTSAVKESR